MGGDIKGQTRCSCEQNRKGMLDVENAMRETPARSYRQVLGEPPVMEAVG
jgi:hypothetical protein